MSASVSMIAISGMTLQQWGLVIGLVAALVLLGNMMRRRSTDAPLRSYRRDADADGVAGGSVRQDVQQLLIELEELSRTINAQIDTRFAKLEQSIADADKRIAALRILIDASQGHPPVGGDHADAAAAAARTDESPNSSASSVPAPARTVAAPPDRHARIYELADRGMTAYDIARELGQGIGEIELILNLRQAAARRDSRSSP